MYIYINSSLVIIMRISKHRLCSFTRSRHCANNIMSGLDGDNYRKNISKCSVGSVSFQSMISCYTHK